LIAKENRHFFETEETANQRINQARDLRKKTETGGLRFEAYLTPNLALWVLDMVEKGEFIDPCEAVFVFMQQAKELDPHDDLKKELLSRRLKSAEDGPYYTMEEVKARHHELAKKQTPSAYWEKIDNNRD